MPSREYRVTVYAIGVDGNEAVCTVDVAANIRSVAERTGIKRAMPVLIKQLIYPKIKTVNVEYKGTNPHAS